MCFHSKARAQKDSTATFLRIKGLAHGDPQKVIDQKAALPILTGGPQMEHAVGIFDTA